MTKFKYLFYRRRDVNAGRFNVHINILPTYTLSSVTIAYVSCINNKNDMKLTVDLNNMIQ